MEGLCDRYAVRRRNSKSGNKFKSEEVEDELEEMVTLASASLRLHNECSAEISRLTKVRPTCTRETEQLIRAVLWNLIVEAGGEVVCTLVLLAIPRGNLLAYSLALQLLNIDHDEGGIFALQDDYVGSASPFLRACDDM